jgi:hypothetical protein
MINESSLDWFYFYDENDLNDETQHDLVEGFIQPRRSLFYNREDGCGIPDRENMPQSIILQIGIRFDIANWIAYRNTIVSTSNEGKERRAAVSQSSISVKLNKNGQVDVEVMYIPFADIENFRKINLMGVKIE